MSNLTIIAIVLAVGLLAFVAGVWRAQSIRRGGGRLHSLPSYHGAYAFLMGVPTALILLGAWNIAEPFYLNEVARSQFPAEVLANETDAKLRLSTIDALARGYQLLSADVRSRVDYGLSDIRSTLAREGVALASDPEPFMLAAARDVVEAKDWLRPTRAALVVGVAVVGGLIGFFMIGAKLRARNLTERFVLVMLISGASIAILTTFGIVMSMITEAIRFFEMVHPQDFFLSTVWDPGFESAGAVGGSATGFGLLPLLWGTMYISLIALLIAVPVGLYAAVYMSEFASKSVRSVAKPLLEVLAGIPTIVYGFFALVTVGPFIRDTINLIPGMSIGASSVATAGVVMGIMIIPFVSSLSDDIINAVPQSLRDGSLGLGATKAETVRLVILPAALPGIVGAVLLAASRAIGETMIVVLAAGATAKIDVNPFEAMTTVTVKIVTQLTGDVEFTSPQALVAFALGITLFVITLFMNIIALRIVRKYREQYE